jgi:hypothetical protein
VVRLVALLNNSGTLVGTDFGARPWITAVGLANLDSDSNLGWLRPMAKGGLQFNASFDAATMVEDKVFESTLAMADIDRDSRSTLSSATMRPSRHYVFRAPRSARTGHRAVSATMSIASVR